MDGETPQSIINRIDHIDRRIKALEKESRGWVAKISRVGIIVGCIGGILGGSSTFLNLWKSVTATPNLHLVFGDGLSVQWSSEKQRLSLTWGVALQNTGEAIGFVKAARAHIKSKAWETGKRERLGEIQLNEKRIPIHFPVSIKPDDARDIEITMASNLTIEEVQALFEEGLCSLTLEVDMPETKSSEYCIYIGESLLKDLREKGVGILDAPDTRC
jgi:hypothetical protein